MLEKEKARQIFNVASRLSKVKDRRKIQLVKQSIRTEILTETEQIIRLSATKVLSQRRSHERMSKICQNTLHLINEPMIRQRLFAERGSIVIKSRGSAELSRHRILIIKHFSLLIARIHTNKLIPYLIFSNKKLEIHVKY